MNNYDPRLLVANENTGFMATEDEIKAHVRIAADADGRIKIQIDPGYRIIHDFKKVDSYKVPGIPIRD